MSFPKYSFVLPAYKGRFLYEALASILGQTYFDFELIVVDDCSPDGIRKIVESFQDSRITYHRNEHNIGGKNLVQQWNHCLKYAKAEYVILATDDDLYEPTFLEEMDSLVKKYPKINLFRARILQVDAENHIRDIDRCYKEVLTQEEFYYHMFHGMRGGIPQYVFRRKVLIEKCGFVDFPKAWASDDATALMMAENGVGNSQNHLVRFRWSDVNISSDKKNMLEKVKARILFGAWLKKNVPKVPRETEEGMFLYKNVNEYLPIYNKITILSHFKRTPIVQRIKGLRLLCATDVFSFKDKLSLTLRSLILF